MTITAKVVQAQLRGLGDPLIAEHSQRFFKTGKGEYGEGDVFLGIRVPVLRKQLKPYQSIALPEVIKLLRSKYHEERLFAVLMMVHQYSRCDAQGKEEIYNTYLAHTAYINNWDIIDVSAPRIVGAQLIDVSRRTLLQLAESQSMWERRIAIIATLYFIRQGDFSDTLKISELLLQDKEDLIHKAVGWMLREVGKQNQEVEEAFLKQYYQTMPRTMLRYAIEKFEEPKRKAYLLGEIG